MKGRSKKSTDGEKLLGPAQIIPNSDRAIALRANNWGIRKGMLNSWDILTSCRIWDLQQSQGDEGRKD